jgi:hypothetical protein
MRKFCFTFMVRLLCSDTKLNPKHTVSPHCSRKSFFAKLGGMLVGLGIVPSLLAKIGTPAARSETVAPVAVRSEQRAVSRKEGSY